MLKALMKKKLGEFRGNGLPKALLFLLAVSLVPLIRLVSDAPLAAFVSVVPLVFGGCLLVPMCALAAFVGDFVNEVNRFLEYLPVRRSAVWLAAYLSGLALLGLAAVSLLWLGVLLFPLGIDSPEMCEGPGAELLSYLVPNRFALAVSCGSILFCAFSVAVFPAGYLGSKDPSPTIAFLVLGMGGLSLPVGIGVTLGLLDICPSGLAISPVLLTSGVLFTVGGYALFALVPKHITPWKHGALGIGLFLALYAVLLGQLYLGHLSWRVLDPSLPQYVSGVYKPGLAGEPDLVLLNVHSYRSGDHCVSLDVERAEHHDLGRGLRFVEVPENDSGLLYFLYTPYLGIDRYENAYFASMAPDGTEMRSFEVPCEESFDTNDLRWLPQRGILVYTAHFEDGRSTYLCVADSTGTLLKRFRVAGASDFLINDAGQALAKAEWETASDESAPAAPMPPEKPYKIIDLDSDSIYRFRLPGNVVYFAKDLSRVICSLKRIEEGRQYEWYVVVDLPSLEERLILGEEEFPPREITSQVDVRVTPSIKTDGGDPEAFLRVNDAFDNGLWIRQRVEGDHFCYSIVLIDLDTAEQTVVVPESAAPKLPVVGTGGTTARPIRVDRFTADQAGFTYSIGAQTYLCVLDNRESVLLADNGILTEGDEEDPEWRGRRGPISLGDYSSSGRRVLRRENVWLKPLSESEPPRFKFSAIEVFDKGKPVRIYTGQRPVGITLWVDEERIVFEEDQRIYLLESSGGPPRQIFPPVRQRGD